MVFVSSWDFGAQRDFVALHLISAGVTNLSQGLGSPATAASQTTVGCSGSKVGDDIQGAITRGCLPSSNFVKDWLKKWYRQRLNPRYHKYGCRKLVPKQQSARKKWSPDVFFYSFLKPAAESKAHSRRATWEENPHPLQWLRGSGRRAGLRQEGRQTLDTTHSRWQSKWSNFRRAMIWIARAGHGKQHPSGCQGINLHLSSLPNTPVFSSHSQGLLFES